MTILSFGTNAPIAPFYAGKGKERTTHKAKERWDGLIGEK